MASAGCSDAIHCSREESTTARAPSGPLAPVTLVEVPQKRSVPPKPVPACSKPYNRLHLQQGCERSKLGARAPVLPSRGAIYAATPTPSHSSSSRALVAPPTRWHRSSESSPTTWHETKLAAGSACPGRLFRLSPKFGSHKPHTRATHLAQSMTCRRHSVDTESHPAIAAGPSTLASPPQ